MVDMYKPRDKKPFTLKENSNNEKEREYTLNRLKQKLEKESGNISISK